MATATNTDLQPLRQLKEHAERAAGSAKYVADALRADYARAVLHVAFPEHSLAVFSRAWDEDTPRLLQLLTDRPDVEDIDLSNSSLAALAPEISSAAYAAQAQIVKIGSDDEILEHLEPAETDHEGWTEFLLPLTTQRRAELTSLT